MLPIYSINFLTKALLGISSSHVYSLGHINMIAKLIQKKHLNKQFILNTHLDSCPESQLTRNQVINTKFEIWVFTFFICVYSKHRFQNPLPNFKIFRLLGLRYV